MSNTSDEFLADARRYLDLAEGRAADGKKAGAINAAWKGSMAARDYVLALEHERAAADRLKRAAK